MNILTALMNSTRILQVVMLHLSNQCPRFCANSGPSLTSGNGKRRHHLMKLLLPNVSKPLSRGKTSRCILRVFGVYFFKILGLNFMNADILTLGIRCHPLVLSEARTYQGRTLQTTQHSFVMLSPLTSVG